MEFLSKVAGYLNHFHLVPVHLNVIIIDNKIQSYITLTSGHVLLTFDHQKVSKSFLTFLRYNGTFYKHL